jgi:hypothetical protein
MNKKLYFTTVLAGLMLAACSSDDTPEQKSMEPVKEPVRTFYMTVDAAKESNDDNARTTRALSLDGSRLTASWAIGEKVYVYAANGTPYKFWFSGYLEAKSAGTTTQLNGALSLPGTWEGGDISKYVPEPYNLTLQFPKAGLRLYTGQKGTLADVSANYDYAVAENVTFDIEGDHIRAVAAATFHSQQAIVKFTLKDKADGTTLLNPTSFTVAYNSENIVLSEIPAATYTTNGNGVLFVAFPALTKEQMEDADVTTSVTLTAVVGGKTYSFTKDPYKFQNGKYYEIGVKMTKDSE